jgi:exopolysaccharide biosynthesis protein
MKTRIRQLTEQEKRSLGESQMIADWLKILDKYSMKKLIILFLISILIYSCENKEYTNKLQKYKVTLELFTNQGNKRIKTFILDDNGICSLNCKTDGNLFDRGYYDLYYFKTYNSWSGSTKRLESNVSSFNIIKKEKLWTIILY